MPDFGSDAIYVWSITLLGIVTPLLLAAYALTRASSAKKRLERLEKDDA
ncbi:MAG: hypothetical protein ABNH53_07280 [Henriciella sp.]|jgi:hypothetical protein